MNIHAKDILPRVIGAAGLVYSMKEVTGLTAAIGPGTGDGEYSKAITDTFVKQQISEKPSEMTEELRKEWQKHLIDDTTISTGYRIKAVAHEFKIQVEEHWMGLALAAGALVGPKPLRVVSAALLVVGGLKKFLGDVMCIGK